MRNNWQAKTLVSFLVCLLIVITGCTIGPGSCCRSKYERTEQLSAPMTNLQAIDVETGFGSIKVVGGDVTDCRVKADISAQAPTDEEAKQLAEEVKIKITPLGKTLNIAVDKPKTRNNCCIGVSFDIIVPQKTNIECSTSYGSIKLRDLHADINARTSFASIESEDTHGSVKLETSFGKIRCRNITSSDINAKSSFGEIDIACSPDTTPQVNADITTSYGDIDFKTPPGFVGQIDLETSFGSIKTDLPITVKGVISKDKIRGVIGEGDGKIRLETSFGSIKIE
ncbi:MAG: DUF4097 family beta strand repeat-containing protein [Planctomycetota bacterium]